MKNKKMKNKEKFFYDLDYDLYLYFYFFYCNLLLHSLIKQGKKIKQINLFLKLKYELKIKEKEDPYLIILIAFLNITPVIYTKKVWVAGANKVMGFPISSEKQVKLVIS